MSTGSSACSDSRPGSLLKGRFAWINGVLHLISPCGERLLRLGERFELVWATGWEETANDYLPHLLGLPGELPCLTFDEHAEFGTAHWKLGAISDYAGPDRPVAWIDDSLTDDCHAWARERPAPTLLVTTESDVGAPGRARRAAARLGGFAHGGRHAAPICSICR